MFALAKPGQDVLVLRQMVNKEHIDAFNLKNSQAAAERISCNILYLGYNFNIGKEVLQMTKFFLILIMGLISFPVLAEQVKIEGMTTDTKNLSSQQSPFSTPVPGVPVTITPSIPPGSSMEGQDSKPSSQPPVTSPPPPQGVNNEPTSSSSDSTQNQGKSDSSY